MKRADTNQKNINKFQMKNNNIASESKRLYDNELYYFAKSYKIFIDTCSLMHSEFSVFYMNMKSKMKTAKNKFIILNKVMDEIENHQNSKNEIIRSKALVAKKNIDCMILDNLIEVRGDYGDEFADQVFHVIFTKFRMENNLMLISQDFHLGMELLSLNRSQSVRVDNKIKIKHIDKWGKLVNFKTNYKFNDSSQSYLSQRFGDAQECHKKNSYSNKEHRRNIFEDKSAQDGTLIEKPTIKPIENITLSTEWNTMEDVCRDLKIYGYEFEQKFLKYGITSNYTQEITEENKRHIWNTMLMDCPSYEMQDLVLIHKLLHHNITKENICMIDAIKLCELCLIDAFRKYQYHLLNCLMNLTDAEWFGDFLLNDTVVCFIVETLKALDIKNGSDSRSLLCLNLLNSKNIMFPNKLNIIYNIATSMTFNVELLLDKIDTICSWFFEEQFCDYELRFLYLLNSIDNINICRRVWMNDNVIRLLTKNAVPLLMEFENDQTKCRNFIKNIFLVENFYEILTLLIEKVFCIQDPNKTYIELHRLESTISIFIENLNLETYFEYCRKNNKTDIMARLICYNDENA